MKIFPDAAMMDGEIERSLTNFVAHFPGFAYTFRLSPEGHGSFPFTSPGIEKLYGLKPEDVKHSMAALHALAHPDDAKRVSESIAESARTMEPWRCEYRILHPSKGERWMEGHTNPQPHPDGGTVWYGYVHDITERKRLEIALSAREREFRSLAENLPDNVVRFDIHGRYLYINPAHERTLGVPASSVIGTTIPDAHNHVKAVFARVVASGQGESVRQPVLVGGETKIHEVNLTPEFDAAGHVISVLGIGRDVTDIYRMQEAIAAREQEFRTLSENTPDTIARYNRECIRTYINPAFARLAGKSDEMLGVTPTHFNSSPQAVAYEQSLRQTMESGEAGEYEFTWPTHDGRIITSHIRIMPERGENGSVVSALAIGRDITEYKRYEAAREASLTEAMRLAKLRSDFLAHMSHELRTPLNGILGYAQIMQRDKTLGERNSNALNVIRHSGEHLLALIEDTLDLTTIESGRLELVRSDIPLRKFLRIVAEIVALRARQKRVEFICELADDLPQGIRGDEKRLRQVLLNLLSNAVKFTDVGHVILRVKRDGALRITFEVEDSGIGIEDRDLETIFHPFEQVGDSQRQYGGTGLGLAISRQLVCLMGGEIAVESRVGYGSTFRFGLELPQVEIAPQSLLSAQVATDYSGPRRRVLVADDIAENRAVMVDLLAPMGFDMFEACDGIEALELAQSLAPDIILMDLLMPRMCGLEAIRNLRQMPEQAHIPIMVLSASTSEGDELVCLKAGADAFLAKPIDQDVLLVQMAALLHLEWGSMPITDAGSRMDKAAPAFLAPPAAEIRELHRLAQLGNMRDILRFTEHIAELDPSFHPFAGHLRQLANAYQSKAILAFIEEHLS